MLFFRICLSKIIFIIIKNVIRLYNVMTNDEKNVYIS